VKTAKIKKTPSLFKRSSLMAVGVVTVLAGIVVPQVQADRFQEQINQLTVENSQKRQTKDQLGAEAASLNDTIAKLEAQIGALQAQINAYQSQIDDLQRQITEQETELARQRKILGENIKAMYLEGQISTLEMLASSKDLSEFIDKQQYRTAVQDKIKTTLDRITELKLQLKAQKEQAEKILNEKQLAQEQLDAQRAESARLLSLNQSQQAQLNAEIKSNFTRIAELRRQQAIENARLFGNGSIPAGTPGGGGYPGVWAFAPIDAMLDNWGMYNRQCVSYTAWKVAISGRYMPGWGWLGLGNANQWDDNARASGIPVDSNPRVGDVAIKNGGQYGHALYVEAVADDGAIYVSDYNQQFDGLYREYWISASTVRANALVFIHFP
jgi:surface antigen/peptidoglycan hydrolase CwlO-like protein